MGPYPLTLIGTPTSISVKRLSDRRLEPAIHRDGSIQCGPRLSPDCDCLWCATEAGPIWAEPSEQPTLGARSHVVEGKMASETDAISRKSNRGILAGVRIVECGEGVSAAFATK